MTLQRIGQLSYPMHGSTGPTTGQISALALRCSCCLLKAILNDHEESIPAHQHFYTFSGEGARTAFFSTGMPNWKAFD